VVKPIFSGSIAWRPFLAKPVEALVSNRTAGSVWPHNYGQNGFSQLGPWLEEWPPIEMPLIG
jgi:hypothetical protein